MSEKHPTKPGLYEMVDFPVKIENGEISRTGFMPVRVTENGRFYMVEHDQGRPEIEVTAVVAAGPYNRLPEIVQTPADEIKVTMTVSEKGLREVTEAIVNIGRAVDELGKTAAITEANCAHLIELVDEAAEAVRSGIEAARG